MKKYAILVLATLMMVGFTANAQRHEGKRAGQNEGKGKHVQMDPKDLAEKMAKKLELTDVQKAKVQSLFEQQVAKREAMKLEYKKLNEKMKADRAASQNELAKIIGQEKYNKMQSDRIDNLQKMNRKLMQNKGKMMNKRIGDVKRPCPADKPCADEKKE